MENQKFSPAFEHALNFILRPDIEGVYVNDPTEPPRVSWRVFYL
nr:hypothetical protein [Escherichia coli]